MAAKIIKTVEQYEIEKKAAEIALLKSQKKYFDLRTDSLEYDREERDAASEARRIYDFSSNVNTSSYEECMEYVSSWASKSRDPITIRFNSPGGSVTDGLALYDFLIRIRSEGVPINTEAFGIAASMAGVLLQAGEKRAVSENCWMLIHEVSSGFWGKTGDAEEELKWVKQLQDQLLTILSERSTLSKKEIMKRWHKSEWWLTSTEIVKHGFADTILLNKVGNGLARTTTRTKSPSREK